MLIRIEAKISNYDNIMLSIAVIKEQFWYCCILIYMSNDKQIMKKKLDFGISTWLIFLAYYDRKNSKEWIREWKSLILKNVFESEKDKRVVQSYNRFLLGQKLSIKLDYLLSSWILYTEI